MDQRSIERIGEKAFAGMIKPLKRCAMESAPFIGFDTEYDSKTRKFLSFQLWHGKKGAFITRKMTPEVIADEVRKLLGFKPPRVVLVAYFSLAELQFFPMARAFELREFGSRSLDCTFQSDDGMVLSIFDLARFFDKQGLAAAAQSCGLRKLEYDRKNVSAKDLKSAKFRKYAIHDAYLCFEITRQLREEFLERGVDILEAKTPASASSRVFRRHYVASILKCESTRARYVGMRGDWGGRTETYVRGVIPRVWEYDISSAYPNAAIALGTLPAGNSWRQIRKLSDIEKCIGGIGHISFRFPTETRYPCIPIVEPTAQLYPLAGHAWCTLAEMRFALSLGAKITPIELWGYSKGTDSLSRYMADLLEQRKVSQGARKIALKLQANSLIGKFAQHTDDLDLEEMRQKAEELNVCLDELMSMTREEQSALGIKKTVSVGTVFMPEWNALITGFVRASLARAIVETGAVYSATDAIWTPKEWKKPHAGFEFKRAGQGILLRTRVAAILGPEDKHVVHHSIWNRNAGLELLMRFADGKTPRKMRYEVNRPRKFRESLKKRLPLGEWVTETREASAHWDNKRRLLEDGTTEPWNDVEEYRAAQERAKG